MMFCLPYQNLAGKIRALHFAYGKFACRCAVSGSFYVFL
ncbi:hypothetical protein TPHV1_110003 [Treponema phagedenis]|uniref:Uncharacterized protein n=1 Tax=Treponema phagedenis TaxID=162 RepID=A0A0B7GTC3_TREPH|nr:hypothetical protein TPHV1_110003 [Treponema phagedenis]